MALIQRVYAKAEPRNYPADRFRTHRMFPSPSSDPGGLPRLFFVVEERDRLVQLGPQILIVPQAGLYLADHALAVEDEHRGDSRDLTCFRKSVCTEGNLVSIPAMVGVLI